jgi:cytochrome c oxidase subunit IV
MATQKSDSSSEKHPVGLYLDLWNLILVLIGVTVVLILRPFWR